MVIEVLKLLSIYWITDILRFNFIVEVEPQYSGARIEGEEVTLDFVKNMMEDFKNQKTLHKRCVLFGVVFNLIITMVICSYFAGIIFVGMHTKLSYRQGKSC